MPFSIQWQKVYGGVGLDAGYSIKPTSDGGYIVAGASRSSDGDISDHIGDVDGWIIKLDQYGSIEWERSLGSTYDDYINSVQQTSDGGYIVAGGSTYLSGSIAGNFDFFIVKLKNTGEIVWQKFFGGSDNDQAFTILETSDNSYVVAGETFSNDGDVTGLHGSSDIWVVKINALGNLLWQKTLGGSGEERAFSIKQTDDGGYIVAGSSSSIDGDINSGPSGEMSWLVKLSDKGILIWQRKYGTPENKIQQPFMSVQLTTDGGYIMAGSCFQNGGDVTGNHGTDDLWIVKVDSNGNLIWQKSLGGSGNDFSQDILQTSSGDYIAVGTTNSRDGDVNDNQVLSSTTLWWVVSLSSSGDIKWKKSFGTIDRGGGAFSVHQTKDGGFIIAGLDGVVTNSYHDPQDLGIIKFIPDDRGNAALSIYPNPTFGQLHVRFLSQGNVNGIVSVFDFLGRVFYRKEILFQSGINYFDINTSTMAAGGYILSVAIKEKYTGKFIKL